MPRDEHRGCPSAVFWPRGPKTRPVCLSIPLSLRRPVHRYQGIPKFQVPPTAATRHVMRTMTVSCSCHSFRFSRSCARPEPAMASHGQPSEHSSNFRDQKRRWIIFPSTASEMAAPEFAAGSLPRTRCCASTQPCTCQTSARRLAETNSVLACLASVLPDRYFNPYLGQAAAHRSEKRPRPTPHHITSHPRKERM